MRINKLITAIALTMTSLTGATAQEAALPSGADGISVCPDDADEALRVSPDLEEAPSTPDYTPVSYLPYPFLHTAANRVALNGADWEPLRVKAAQTGERPLRIVLIGDSHIQADVATAVTRRLLQHRLGGAGRGLVTPLKLIGSNQPADYTLTSSTPGWATARLMKRPHDSKMLFTGASATPPAGKFDLSVELLPTATCREFSQLTIVYGGEAPQVEGVSAGGTALPYRVESSAPGLLTLRLERAVSGCTLQMHSEGDTQIGGLRLLGADKGVEFTTIGNNGAAFGSYLGLGTGAGVAGLSPDLIILAMGGNDAWGDMTDGQFTASIDSLVNELQRANPEARILLTTPAEAQKRQGKKGAYAPHVKIKHFRDLLLDYGARSGVATWDFYEIAGGDGSSLPWNEAGLFARDRIHLSLKGYPLMGQLLGEALIDVLTAKSTNDE